MSLIRSRRRNLPCSEAILWNGTRLIHPADQIGLVGTILELWYDQVYSSGDFFRAGERDVVVDIGAHIGLFSIWVANRYRDVRVFSLEPCNENFRCLVANINSLNTVSIVALQTAVSGEYGWGIMQESTGRSFDYQLCQVDSECDNAVKTIPLDGIFDLVKSDHISFVKMDIEGAEFEAFSAVGDDSLRRIDRLSIEYHENIKPGVLDLLTRRLEPTHRLKVYPKEGQEYGILFAQRNV